MALPEYVPLEQLQDALKSSAGAGAATAADLDVDRLQAALTEAHAEVLGRLATIYAVPADPDLAPEMVKSLITTIAAYLATLEWLQGKDLSDRDPIVLRYNRTQTVLRQVTDGVLSVDGLEKASAGEFDAVSYETTPVLDLAGDVAAMTYGGYTAAGWRGGNREWR
jgi:phage gp36-like protein